VGDCGEFVEELYYGYCSQGVCYDADAWMEIEGCLGSDKKRKEG
jgi:hypothetical protein